MMESCNKPRASVSLPVWTARVLAIALVVLFLSPTKSDATTHYDAGVEAFGSFRPLTVGADFNLGVPGVPGYSVSLNIPEQPITFQAGPYQFGFDGFDFLQVFEFSTDISAAASLRLSGDLNLSGSLVLKKGSDTAVLTGSIGAGVSLTASVTPDGFFRNIPFGVGSFLTKTRSVSVPIAGTPTFSVSKDLHLVAPAPIDETFTVGPHASVFAESSANVGVTLFFRGSNQSRPVPEPNTAALGGFGAIGVVGCVWRVRKAAARARAA